MRPIDFVRARQRLNAQIEREAAAATKDPSVQSTESKAPAVQPVKHPDPFVVPAERRGDGVVFAPSAMAEESDAPASTATNLNTCTRSDLIALDGVGPALADRIIAGRPWASIDDVADVRGVSLAMLESWEVVL